MDNATRVQRLGAGLSLPRPKYRESAVAEHLQRLRGDPRFRQRCAQLAPAVPHLETSRGRDLLSFNPDRELLRCRQMKPARWLTDARL
jgi:hypothetical protein